MATRKEIQARISFRKEALALLYDAYRQLSSGGVKSYLIDDRQLTRYNLPEIWDQIKALEAEIDDLEGQLDGGLRARRAFGIIPLE